MLHGAGHNSDDNKQEAHNIYYPTKHTLTFCNDDNAIGRFNTAVHYFIKNLNTYIIIVH